MRLPLLITAALLFPFFLATAQTEESTKNSGPVTRLLPTYGAKGAFNITRVTGPEIKPGSKYYGLLGGSLGFFGSLPVTENLSTELSLLYSVKGYQTDFYYTENNRLFYYKAYGRFNYFDLPFLLKYNFPAGTRRFSFSAGPQLSVFVRRSEVLHIYEPNRVTTPIVYEPKGKEDLRSFTLGYVIGAQLNLRLFSLGINIVNDVTNFTKPDRTPLGGNLTHKMVQVMGYFPLGHIKPKYTGEPI